MYIYACLRYVYTHAHTHVFMCSRTCTTSYEYYMYIVRCTLVRGTMYEVLCTRYKVHSTRYIVQGSCYHRLELACCVLCTLVRCTMCMCVRVRTVVRGACAWCVVPEWSVSLSVPCHCMCTTAGHNRSNQNAYTRWSRFSISPIGLCSHHSLSERESSSRANGHGRAFLYHMYDVRTYSTSY